jgi:ketosteroid isomerase-like protein
VALDPIAAYERYSAAWNANDAGQAAQLLTESWADHGVLVDPDNPEGVTGREALLDYIARTQAEMVGLDISDSSEPELLGGRMRTTWKATESGKVMFTGTDFIEFAPDGRISRLTMFYDSTPE